MQGSTSIMAEADPAMLRQPTAAEQRLDSSLKQQRSNGAKILSHIATRDPVSRSRLVVMHEILSNKWVLIVHTCPAQVLRAQRSRMAVSQMIWSDGATMCNYPAFRRAQVTPC